MNLSLTIGIIVVFMLGAFGAAVVVSRRQDQKQRALSVITRNKAVGPSGDDRDKQAAKHRAEIARKLKEAGQQDEAKKKDRVSVKEMLIQAGFENTPPERFWIYSAVFAVCVCGMLALMTDWPPVGVILATVAAFLGLPRLFLKKKAAKRQKKFLAEFPDALDASVRLLQAGMPMTEAISMAAREFTGPLREEMQRIYENQRVGVAIGAAALETARRIPLTEVYMFATALQIQSETGSSLSEVLSNLSNIIRARFRLKRKVHALSSEAKASASIIGCLPVLVTLGLNWANPEYVSLLYTTSTGKMLATGALCWMLIGVIIMKQMINFKI